jgi:formin 2
MRKDGGMIGRGRRTGNAGHGRGRHTADQARWSLLALALLAGGCTAGQGPEAIGPLFSNMFGPANEGREPPPGAGAAYPNLGTIPPRPALADPAMRDALTAALAEQRQRSRNPLDPEMRPQPVRPAGTEGDRAMPMRPPGPPPLAAARRIPWDDPLMPAAPAALPAAPAAPAPPPAASRPAPAAAPAASAPAATAPAAAPLPEMGATPPPPPPADLLAPGAGPPPLPPADLLAPPRR